jgi:hypothetical protein
MAHLMRLKEQGGTAWPAAPKALLLSPTHELAAQTARVLKLLLPGSGLKCCLLSKKSAGVCGCGCLWVVRTLRASFFGVHRAAACQAACANPMQAHRSLLHSLQSELC